MAFSFCQQARSAEAFLFHKLPSFKVERIQIFFFGCALPFSVLAKPDKMPAMYVRFKIFPAVFFGVHFSARPAVRASLALPAVCASHASQCASVRRPRQPSTRQRPSARPRFSLRQSTPAVYASPRPRPRAHALARADSCQPSARARFRPRRLYGMAAPYMVDCPPVTC